MRGTLICFRFDLLPVYCDLVNMNKVVSVGSYISYAERDTALTAAVVLFWEQVLWPTQCVCRKSAGVVGQDSTGPRYLSETGQRRQRAEIRSGPGIGVISKIIAVCNAKSIQRWLLLRKYFKYQWINLVYCFHAIKPAVSFRALFNVSWGYN